MIPLKISISRQLEVKFLSDYLDSQTKSDLSIIADLGGEKNNYNRLLRKYSNHVITFNLAEKKPDQIADLTQSYIDLLLEHSPKIIVSINTIEHLFTDDFFFSDIIQYLSTRHSKALIICPFLHRIHAAPFDFRRYTYFGIQCTINRIIANLPHTSIDVTYKITPIGGHWTTLVLSILHQQSFLLGTFTYPFLKALFLLELTLRLFCKHILKRNTKVNPCDYALGYAIEMTSI